VSLTLPSEIHPATALPIATTIQTAKVLNVEPKIGIFLDVGVSKVPAFVHISRISSDGKIDVLPRDSGPYQVGSVHAARIIGFNAMDGLYLASMEKKILEQPFLRVEDIEIGEVVKGTIDRVLDSGSIIVNLAEGIKGFVNELNVSDVKLKSPGNKFREGAEVKARVRFSGPLLGVGD
jgi:rRNA biogenesis protein RRP5